MLSSLQKQIFKDTVNLLKSNNIPFQITGGLAAIAYGAKRPLYDIDIDVSKKDIQKVRELFRQYITEDFHHLQNGKFDIYVMTLTINGVEVDISQAEENYVIDKKGNKFGYNVDLSKAKLIDIEGVGIPVEDKTELINYKTILARETDLIDIEQMK